MGFALAWTGRAHESLPELHEAAALARQTGPNALDVEYVIFAALGLVLCGEAAAARVLLPPLIHDLRADGALGHLPFALYVSAAESLRVRDPGGSPRGRPRRPGRPGTARAEPGPT